jgi:hypothetical protein
MSQPSAQSSATYCRAEVLTREQLARYELPDPPRMNLLELYRVLFHSESIFTAIVGAFEVAGRLPKRSDETYRVWDAYLILDKIGQEAGIKLPGPPRIETSLVTFPSLYLLGKLEETWWEPVEAARIGLNLAWRARYPTFIKDPSTGQLREETSDEVEQRLRTLQPRMMEELKALAERLPSDEVFWKERLGTHAWLVITLRKAHFESLARLCADQLSAAADLAEVRLGKTRREIRALVGRVNSDLTAPALTAASFSMDWKAFDAALDELEQDLPQYNAAMPAALQLAPDQPEHFLRFLANSGLQAWYTELTTVAWHRSISFDFSYDQRVAVVYGRVRTLCALLEEALLSLADSTGHAAFSEAVEEQHLLRRRLVRFLRGPGGRSQLVNVPQLEQSADANAIRPGMDSPEVRTRFLALGIPSRQANTQAPQSPEQVLASLVVVRNLTSHRFPIIQAGERAPWFEAWGEHLPAINRAVLWAALMVWAVATHHKTHP